MSAEVEIVICYRQGTSEMLGVCLESIQRHTKAQAKVLIVHHDAQSFDANAEVESLKTMSVEVQSVALDALPPSGSGVHGRLLDAVTPTIEVPYTLTLDSDCFPVADGWLIALLDMMSEDVGCCGVLHPWAPPPDDLPECKIEYRVRSQHCWNLTHVACQLVRTDLLASLRNVNIDFSSGDDTGLLIPQWMSRLDMKVYGFRPTRCPKPQGSHDPEFNRYVCLVYGDMVCHAGGFTRQTVLQDKPVLEQHYGWATQKILQEKGAEFLLDDECSYRFQFDREEEVAQEKMDRLFGLRNEL